MSGSLLRCSYVSFGSETSQTALAATREGTSEQRGKFVPKAVVSTLRQRATLSGYAQTLNKRQAGC
jgi:hypothetical protein